MSHHHPIFITQCRIYFLIVFFLFSYNAIAQDQARSFDLSNLEKTSELTIEQKKNLSPTSDEKPLLIDQRLVETSLQILDALKKYTIMFGNHVLYIILGVLLLLLFFCIRLLFWYRKTQSSLEEQFSESEKTIRPSLRDSSKSTFALLSGKGGTGKTTISATMSFLLANCGFKTLVVDVDLFTNGLTRLLSKHLPEDYSVSLMQVIQKKCDLEELVPVPIISEMTQNNLFFLPSIDSTRMSQPHELHLADINDVESFAKVLKDLLELQKEKGKFDYILLDTRGGTDLTNIGATLAAGAYLLVTEADKPSWDITEQVLATLSANHKKMNVPIQELGFIINKDMIDDDSMIQYLKERWEIPYMGKATFDAKVIESFQQSSVVIENEPYTDFVNAIVHIIHQQFQSSGWNNYHIAKLAQWTSPSLRKQFTSVLKNTLGL